MRNQLMRDFIWYRHTASGRVIIYHASPAQPSSGNLREVSMTPSPKSRQLTVSEEGEGNSKSNSKTKSVEQGAMIKPAAQAPPAFEPAKAISQNESCGARLEASKAAVEVTGTYL